MTRLHEALQRAQSSTGEPATAGTGAAGASPAEPWQFDAEEFEITPPPSNDSSELPPPIDSVELVPGKSDGAEVRYNFASGTSEKLVVGGTAETNLVEQFRRLAAALHHAQRQSGDRTVMIASAVEAEGKTLTAANLALTLSHSYQRRVLLIDADLRRPAVHDLFQLDNRIGLGDVLKHASAKLPVQNVSPTLWVMTGGRPVPDPMSGLVSDTMRQILMDAAEQFDWVVVDTPPVALLPDANLLAAMIDVALLVVRANSTPYPLVMRAVDAIGTSRLLGIVLNRIDRSAIPGGYGYYNYGYSYHTSPKVERSRRRFPFPFRRNA